MLLCPTKKKNLYSAKILGQNGTKQTEENCENLTLKKSEKWYIGLGDESSYIDIRKRTSHLHPTPIFYDAFYWPFQSIHEICLVKGALDNIFQFSFWLNFIYQIKIDC